MNRLSRGAVAKIEKDENKLMPIAYHETLSPARSSNYINKQVQKVLRDAVDRLDWSDSKVARVANLSQSTVYRVLNAKTSLPPFSLVYDLCQTLGIALPFSGEGNYFTSPIILSLGYAPSNTSGGKTKQVHVLPELRHYLVAEVIDDCANRKYPKGSLLFFSDVEDTLILPDQYVIVTVSSKKNKKQYSIPMQVLGSPEEEEWILYPLSGNRNEQYSYIINKKTLSGQIGHKKAAITAIIHRALI